MARYVKFNYRTFKPGLIFAAAVDGAKLLADHSLGNENFWLREAATSAGEYATVGLGVRLTKAALDSPAKLTDSVIKFVDSLQLSSDVAIEYEIPPNLSLEGAWLANLLNGTICADGIGAAGFNIGLNGAEAVCDLESKADLAAEISKAADASFVRISAKTDRIRQSQAEVMPFWLRAAKDGMTYRTIDTRASGLGTVLKNTLELPVIVDCPHVAQDDLNTLILSERADFCGVSDKNIAAALPDLMDFWENAESYHPGLSRPSGTKTIYTSNHEE